MRANGGSFGLRSLFILCGAGLVALSSCSLLADLDSLGAGTEADAGETSFPAGPSGFGLGGQPNAPASLPVPDNGGAGQGGQPSGAELDAGGPRPTPPMMPGTTTDVGLGGTGGIPSTGAGGNEEDAGAVGMNGGTAGMAPGASGMGGQPSGQGGQPAIGGSQLYWLQHGTDSVHRSRLDGTDASTLLTISGGNSYFRSISVDVSGGKIYFTDDARARLQRANLDGSGLQDIVTGLHDPVGIDLDVAAGHVYFADQGDTPRIYRANLDGSELTPLIEDTLPHPYGVALHLAAGHLYIVDNEADGLFRANLDGSELTDLAVGGMIAPIEVAVDAVNGKVYWTDIGPPPVIRRASLDGSAVEDVVTPETFAALALPLGLELDVAGNAAFFVDGGTAGSIRRVALDSLSVQTVLSDLTEPVGITIAP